MPFYDYLCTQCGRRIEVMHGIHAEGPTTCEVCGGELKKAMSSQAVVYSGHKEPAEHYWEQLKGAGLTMAPLERC